MVEWPEVFNSKPEPLVARQDVYRHPVVDVFVWGIEPLEVGRIELPYLLEQGYCRQTRLEASPVCHMDERALADLLLVLLEGRFKLVGTEFDSRQVQIVQPFG